MVKIIANPDNKATVLGTALWGWAVDRGEAFGMMDRYVERGGRIIDCASNYPINKKPEDCGRAEQWISEWLEENGSEQVKVWMKLGAVDNLGSSRNDLSAPRLAHLLEKYRDRLGPALGVFAVHWDNRDERAEIGESLQILSEAYNAGIQIGFSGVRHPEVYAELKPELAKEWWIQVKENITTDAARKNYSNYFPRARYFAYGINMGGVKLKAATPQSSAALRGVTAPAGLIESLEAFLASDHGLKPEPQSLNQLALAHTFLNPGLSGVILGPRNVEQLDASLDYWEELQKKSTPEMYRTIEHLQTSQ